MTLETLPSESDDRRWHQDHLLLYPDKTRLASSSSSIGNDDDSSVAMELFLRNRMDAALSNDEDENGVARAPAFTPYELDDVNDGARSEHAEPQMADSGVRQDDEPSWTRQQEAPMPDPSDSSNASSVSAASSSSSDLPNSTGTAATVASTPPAANIPVMDVPDPSLSRCTTPTSLSLPADHSSSPPQTIYNPVTSYSPSSRGQRREIMGFSLVRWKSTPDLKPRKESEDAGLELTPSPTTDEEDSNDFDDDNSEFALERWARKIRRELRRAEIAQVALEAERAAESGLESFTAKLSTYGNGDALLSPESSGTGSVELGRASQTRRLRRRKSFSEGTKVTVATRQSNPSFQYRYQSAAPLGVMNLRDVNEVFPCFSQFHNHLRTHLVRSGVDDRTLLFRESSWSDASNGIGHRMLSPDLLFPNQWGSRGKDTMGGASGGVSSSRSRSPPDFFQLNRIQSEIAKHKKSPSDFFQSLSFDRWVKPASSKDPSVEYTGSADLLADHTMVAGQAPRPASVVVPPGLEMPSLEPPFGGARSASPASPESVRSIVKTVHSGLARALFDDEEPDSDGDSATGDQALRTHNDGPPLDPQMRPYSRFKGRAKYRRRGRRAPSFESPSFSADPPPPPHDPPPPPEHSDFMTPARLRVIRDSSNVLLRDDALLTPNSMIETSDGNLYGSVEAPSNHYQEPSILMPQNLDAGGVVDRRSDHDQYLTEHDRRIYVAFKPQASKLVTEETVTNEEIPSPPISPPPVTSFDEVVAMRSDETDAVAELEAATRQEDNVRDDVSATDCYEIGRMLTPECDHAKDENGTISADHASTLDREGQNRSIVTILGSNCTDREDATSVNTSGILHSQTVEFIEPPAVLGTVPLSPGCTCLALSPVSSHDSACSTPVQIVPERQVIAKPHLLRRSSSANALSSLEQTPQGMNWNPFGGTKVASRDESASDAGAGNKPFHQTALNLFSRISPRRKSMYLPPRENDDFLHNYLYCSKTEGVELQPKPKEVGIQGMCANVSMELCFCASLFPDSSLNSFLTNRKSATSMPLFSLSGDNNPTGGYHHMDTETWFDLNQFEFLDQLSGRGPRQTDESPWKVNFQAPTLRKGESCRKLRAASVVEEEMQSIEGSFREVTTDEYRGVEEKKSEERNSSRSPKHSRHLSYFPSRQGPHFALSDNQFEMIYGVAPGDLADSLTRDLRPYRGAQLRRQEDATATDVRSATEGDESEVAAVVVKSRPSSPRLIASARSI